MDPAIVAHTVVAAHAQRVAELTHLYELLERAAVATGPASDAARNQHRILCARLLEWEGADMDAERQDVISLAGDEREEMLRAIESAITDAERHAEGLPPTADEQGVLASLQRARAAFPAVLTRAAVAELRRSAARRRRIASLNGPAFLLGNEAAVLSGVLEYASTPIAPAEIQFDPEDGFRGTFACGLRACVLREPGAVGSVDLGLGTSPAVAVLLGVAAGEDLDALYQRWTRSADPAHPFARYPYVPSSRFCGVSSASPVRGDLDSTGPIGWVAADGVVAMARDFAAVARAHTNFATEVQAVSNRVESTGRRGCAIIGFIEYLSPEREGERRWLVEPRADGT